MTFLLSLLVAIPLFMSVHASPMDRPDIVLIVDDDPTDLYLAELYMRDYYCVVTVCPTAREGLKRVASDYFDYGFLDFQLDGMNALDFINQQHSKNPHIQWYIMSDVWRTDSRSLAETARLGATAILKSSIRQDGLRMKNFQQTLDWILKPKRL